MKYRIQPFVFYRSYGDSTVLYHTKKRMVFVYSGSCGEILDAFSREITVSECVEQIRKRCPDLDEAGEQAIRDYVSKLCEDDILGGEHLLEEDKANIEGYVKYNVIPEGQLYSVQFELTFRCNERCKHCYCVDSSKPEDAKELTTEEIKAVLDDLLEMGVSEVTFTGGELFMRRDVWEILTYANQKRFVINLFSNGNLLTDSDILRIHDLYPRSVHFSIYSSIPERHDAFTGVTGSFQKTTDVIKKLVSLGVPVNIKTSVMNWNQDEFEEILLLAKDLGTTIQVSLSISAKNDGGTEPLDYRLKSAADYAKIMRIASKHIRVHCSDQLKILRGDDGRICGAGAYSLNINPYGEVFPCNALLLSCGNVRNQSIKAIWETSDVLKRVRDFTVTQIEGCQDCPELRYCNYCPGSALTETGNPLKKYSEACTITAAKRLSAAQAET